MSACSPAQKVSFHIFLRFPFSLWHGDYDKEGSEEADRAKEEVGVVDVEGLVYKFFINNNKKLNHKNKHHCCCVRVVDVDTKSPYHQQYHKYCYSHHFVGDTSTALG